MFYDKFELLCEIKGVTPTQVAREIGIAQPSISLWKKRGSTPSAAVLARLSEYFDVSMEFLMSQNSEKGLAPGSAKKDMDEEISLLKSFSNGRKKNEESIPSRLLAAIEKLNDKGQSVAAERVEELTKIPDYQRIERPPEATQEPPEDKK